MRLYVPPQAGQLERKRSVNIHPVFSKVGQRHPWLALELPHALDEIRAGGPLGYYVIVGHHPLDARQIDEVAFVGERALQILGRASQRTESVDRLDQYFGFAVVGRSVKSV